MTNDIEVELTDEKVLHCFKVIYHVTIPGQTERAPIEIYLHATQAFDLFHKLGAALQEYFARTSADLLQKVYENHEARDLLEEVSNMMKTEIDVGSQWAPEELLSQIRKIDSFLGHTSAINHPKVGETSGG